MKKTINKMTDEEAIKLAGGFKKGIKFMKQAPEQGERAWLIEGKKKNIYVWDLGNGHCKIISESDNNGRTNTK